MPDPTTKERLRGLVLSAKDLKALSDWPDVLVEDYLNIIDNLITISDLLDTEIDTKIEEIATDFTDGSVPFVESELLAEDNTNFFWNNITKILTLSGALLNNLTASRLIASDANKNIVSIAALSAWIAGTANQILITDDGDGSVTISIPDTDITGTELETLTDDSMADTLHRHSELSASDGDPDACVQVNATGEVVFSRSLSSGTLTHSAVGPTDNLDVSGVNTVFMDCSGGNVTIGGFVGGVNGQVLHIVRL